MAPKRPSAVGAEPQPKKIASTPEASRENVVLIPALLSGMARATQFTKNDELGDAPKLSKPDRSGGNEVGAKQIKPYRHEQKTAEGYCTLAQHLAEDGKVSDSIKAFRQALKHDPGHALACVSLGQILFQKNQLSEAIKVLRAGIKLRPNDYRLNGLLGTVLAEANQPEEAIKFLDTAIFARPNAPAFHAALGIALTMCGDNTTAIVSLRKAIEIYQSYEETSAAELAISYFSLGNALLRTGQFHEAICSFIRGKEIDPNTLTSNSIIEALTIAVGESKSVDYTPSMNILDKTILALAELTDIPAQSIKDFISFSQAKSSGATNEKSLVLPNKAPRLYADRPAGQGIIDFLKDPAGWGPYLEGKLLSRSELRRLDPSAYMALANWLRNNKLPYDMHLPTKKEETDRIAAQMPAAQRPAKVDWALRSRAYRAGRVEQ